MAWQVEVLACRPADLSVIPGLHRVEGEKVLIVIFQTPHIHYGLRLPCPSPSLSFPLPPRPLSVTCTYTQTDRLSKIHGLRRMVIIMTWNLTN